ncbi:MAG: alpha/beta hydrolase [Polyangiaceae bacterium]
MTARAAVALLGLALAGCAGNMLGRSVAVESHDYTFKDESLSFVEGTSLSDPKGDATKRPPEYTTQPVALFLEGDGSECQKYSDTGWEKFVRRFAGDYVLVRAKTFVNATCGTEKFAKFDFLSRLDELGVLLTEIKKTHEKQPIVLIGHSAGATLAVMYANAHPGEIAGLVNLGGGLDPLERVIKQAEREKGLDPESLRESEGTIDAAIETAKGGGNPDKAMWGRTEKFWGQMFSVEVKEEWLKATVPVLVVHGDADVVVPFALMAKNKRELKRKSKTNFAFDFEHGMNHDLFNDSVFLTVNDWIKKKIIDKAGGADGPAEHEPDEKEPGDAHDDAKAGPER